MIARRNIYIDQGVDFVTSLELETDDGEEYDITDNQFFSHVRKTYSSSNAIEMETNVVNGDSTNIIVLTIPAGLTENLKPGKYQYDVIMVYPSTKKTKILEGLLFINETTTRNFND